MLLAKAFDPDLHDITGFMMSEKLDGMRAKWTGKSFLSRNGNPIYTPDWFVEDLPNFQLDGELYLGNQNFDNCLSIVRRHNPNDEDWQKISFCIFDAPALKEPFCNRYKFLKDWENRISPRYAYILEHAECKGIKHLYQELDRVLAEGGEGIMLRDPNSYYENKRSASLLKVKKMHEAEALVMAKEKGQGRIAGMMGKLLVKLPNNLEFRIGSGFTDAERQSPPNIGDIVTFKYQEITKNGIPRFPIYLRTRPDITWRNVCENAQNPDYGKQIACKYGKDCYRKNPQHLQDYSHIF